MNKEFDLSSFTGGKVLEDQEEIIELAVTLAKINRLYEMGEIPNRTLPPIQESHLKLIRRVLEKYEDNPEAEEFSSYKLLMQRLQDI